jgi:hypothetical protein
MNLRLFPAAFVLATSVAASANTTIFTDSAAFATRASSQTNVTLPQVFGDFNYYNGTFTTTDANPFTVTENNVNRSLFVVAPSYTSCCNMGIETVYGHGDMSFFFASPVYSVSFLEGNGGSSPTSSNTFGGDNNITVNGQTYTVGGGSGHVPQFVGITSDTPFTSFSILSSDYNNLELAEITYSSSPSSPVPEPSSLALLGTGLLGSMSANPSQVQPLDSFPSTP